MSRKPNTDIDVMIDIETAGRAPKGTILSIGAVKFYRTTGVFEDEFLVRLDPHSQYPNRIMDSRTIEWWFRQDPIVREQEWSGRASLGLALAELSSWLGTWNEDYYAVWANGVTFDLAILDDAFSQYRSSLPQPPWPYHAETCMRPIRLIGETLGFSYEQVIEYMGLMQHNPLDDAKMQAEYVCRVLDAIFTTTEAYKR